MTTYFLTKDETVSISLPKKQSAVKQASLVTSPPQRCVRIVSAQPSPVNKMHQPTSPDAHHAAAPRSPFAGDAVAGTSQSSAPRIQRQSQSTTNPAMSSPTYIHPHHIHYAPIATVEPSPAKPMVNDATQNGSHQLPNKQPLPGYGEQRKNMPNTPQVISTAGNKMCSSACTIL